MRACVWPPSGRAAEWTRRYALAMTDSGSAAERVVLTHLVIPLATGDTKKLTAVAGGRTVIVGANGAGKSALGLRLAAQSAAAPGGVKRILGHRRLWFETAGPNMTSAARHQYGQQATNFGARQDLRYDGSSQCARSRLDII